jgi:hypothetical protein
MARKPGRMAGIGNRTIDKTNFQLSDVELDVISSTSIDWDSLKPQITDKDSYEKLIKAVNEATQNNEDIALLKDRLEGLGKGVIDVAKKIYVIVK